MKDHITTYLKNLRQSICQEFEKIERELIGTHADMPPGSFTFKPWDRKGGGQGEMGIMKGRVFEKVGVNISKVFGEFSENFRKEIPGTEESPVFYANGLSLVAHLQSPLVPAVHMNIRFIETGKHWFGGGMDLTPMIPNDDDTKFFHAALKKMCDRHNPNYYPKFSKDCDEYFYLKHRKEPRGAGGIFYDYLNTGNANADFDFMKDVGQTFLEKYPAIVRKHMNEPWTPEQRELQLIKRGRYAEFNLLYDRGTRFGIMTDANQDAVLMSLPPIVKWP